MQRFQETKQERWSGVEIVERNSLKTKLRLKRGYEMLLVDKIKEHLIVFWKHNTGK